MKNKVMSLFLATFLVMSLTGCNNSTSPKTTSTEKSSTSSESETNNITQSEGETNNTTQSGSETSTSTQLSSNNTTSITNTNNITANQALENALAHAGLTADDITLINVSLDVDNRRQVYEVDFFSGDTEYDYDIDAATGDIIGFDYDVEYYSASMNASSEASSDNIGEDAAKSIALAKVSGATESDIWMKLDYEDGKTVYEGSIIYNGSEYEFEIEAATGTILSWEFESIFD